jgi:hypothetical protein
MPDSEFDLNSGRSRIEYIVSKRGQAQFVAVVGDLLFVAGF